MSEGLRRIAILPSIRFCLALGFAWIFLAATPAAFAAKHGTDGNQARVRAARQACLDGDYTQGVAILSKLFVETNDPNFIFNQGRCFEQNRRYEDAIARFQEYLRAGRRTLNASDKADAEQRIADCKEMLAQQHPSEPVPAAAPAAPPTAQAPLPEDRPAPALATVAPPPAAPSSGSGLRTGGVVVASVGVAVVVAGVLFNVKANNTVSDMYSAFDGYTQESNRSTDETIAWIAYGAGAACIATGAILYAVGMKAKSPKSASVALVPTVRHDAAGAVLVGGF